MSDPLQDLADQLCRGFCGWQLHHDTRVLATLGSGRLEIDLLWKTCRFERRFIPALVIVDILDRRLRQHLADSEIARDTVRTARLSIMLEIEEHEEQKDRSVMWFGTYDGFLGCKIEIRATISTADETRNSRYSGYVEWPRRSTTAHPVP